MSRKLFRLMTAVFGGFLALFAFSAIVSPPKTGEWISFVCIFGLFATGTVIVVGFGWIRTSFIARVDESGVTRITVWGKRKFVPWSQIKSCIQTQTSSLIYNSMGFVWDFKDTQGDTVAHVVPFDVPEVQQQQFSQAVSRYLAPSALV
ncbi:hypothetical protein IAD21_04107 [Abditibacteriota bacterium]|nr:hypothetical protein IAD21_04107 [Abditibacteriota bacterium]